MTVNAVPRTAPAARPRRTVAGLAAAIALAFTIALPGVVFAWDAGSFSSADEQLLVTLTNQARAAAGLAALKVDPELVDMARWRSQDMIERNYFSHSIPPDGKKVFDYLTASGYCFKIAGENLGTNNFPDDIATETIQQGFMDSAGHRANILGASWTVIGVGAYEGADGKHMWTVLFAAPCAATATPSPTATPAPATPSPTATPRATATPTAAPQPTPPPRPTPEATTAPTPTPTPTPAADPTAGASPEPAAPAPASATEPPATPVPAGASEPVPGAPGPVETTTATASRGPSGGLGRALGSRPIPGPAAAAVRGPSLRIVDPPFAADLVDAIVGDVAGSFFGN